MNSKEVAVIPNLSGELRDNVNKSYISHLCPADVRFWIFCLFDVRVFRGKPELRRHALCTTRHCCCCSECKQIVCFFEKKGDKTADLVDPGEHSFV